jgi:colanic acid/amylovoran biosynthesis glycosyltransferase
MSLSIAFIVWEFPVLSETFILNQITGLIDRGHQVDIYPLNGRPPKTTKVHPDIEKYALLQQTYYAPGISTNYLVRALTGLSLLLTNFHKNPLLFLKSLNVFSYGMQAASLRLLHMVIPFIKHKMYDIVHCQFGNIGLEYLNIRRVGQFNSKMVVSFRGYDISQWLQQHGDEVYNTLFAQGDVFLTNCEFFRRRLVDLGCEAEKVFVHASGIDCERFVFTPRAPSSDGRIRIATTGRLVEKKGIEYAIRAVAKLARSYPNLEYNIIGDGPLRTDLQCLIHTLNVSDVVRLVGEKEQQELITILSHTDIFIATSVTAKDGNQDAPVNVLKEAMAMGLPVIGTRHGGIPELIEDGVSGFLVPERNTEAIVEKVRYLIDHPQVWPEMGRAGRACIEERYNLHKLNDALVALYGRLLTSVAEAACSEQS